MNNNIDNNCTNKAGNSRRLSPNAATLMASRHGPYPAWIRSPVVGPCRYCGLTRAYLYLLAGSGKIRTVAIREPGKAKGIRLFSLPSIFEFIEKQADTSNAESAPETT
jgi:hypothetical protein